MESGGINAANIDRLSAGDRVELQRFVEAEQQKANIQAGSHALTSTCWKKCIQGSINSGTLDKNESSCLTNCVGRFMDANVLGIEHLRRLQN